MYIKMYDNLLFVHLKKNRKIENSKYTLFSREYQCTDKH